MSFQLVSSQLPGDWHPEASTLLFESGGEATVLLVGPTGLEGSDPVSNLPLAREISRRLTTVGLNPTVLFLGSSTVARTVAEWVELFGTFKGKRLIYAARFENCLACIYPGQTTGSDSMGSPPSPARPALPHTQPGQLQEHRRRFYHPMFPNYHGNPLIVDNWPKDIPPEANTSLWIDGLRGDTTHRDVLASIRNAGNIKSLHINKPTDISLGSAAAKVVFFTRRSAEAVLTANLGGHFIVRGVVPRVTWNRWKTEEDPPNGRSRVLLIRGPANIVNRAFLETFWKSRMWWDTDEVIEGEPGARQDGRNIVCYRFGSWRCQAATAKRELEKAFEAVVDVEYGDDPCA